MSRDSTATFIHMHASHHADLFEEFCHPPSSSASTTQQQAATNPGGQQPNNQQQQQQQQGGGNDPSMVQIPGHFLPFEDIQLPAHLMPLNPEDEDDVVPDMHAAFGITRALNGTVSGGGGYHADGSRDGGPTQLSGEESSRGAQQEPVWRDLGLDRLLDGTAAGRTQEAATVTTSTITAAKREGRRTGILLMR